MLSGHKLKFAGAGVILVMVVLGTAHDIYQIFIDDTVVPVGVIGVENESGIASSDLEGLEILQEQQEEDILMRLSDLDKDDLTPDEVAELERLLGFARALQMFDPEVEMLIEQQIAEYK